jgi:2,3-bisphosphoglycerate-dependent phosphoglycerate mutase
MQFYFIRHGQSANNLLWDQTGSNVGRSDDAELTDVGRRQAELLARFLRRTDSTINSDAPDRLNRSGFHLTHLYSSLMVRAVATGSIISEILGLPLIAWEDLHETGGIYMEYPETGEQVGQPGKNRAYFQAHYPRLVLPDHLDENGWWNRPVEPREERPLRAQRFLHELLQRHGQTTDRVAVVSHGAFYNYLMAVILGLPERDRLWFILNNAAITRIDFESEHTDVVYMNRADHLPDELIT